MSTGTLEGHVATHVRVQLPAWGVWYADVSLAGEHTLTGSVTLVVADLTLVGSVVSGGPSRGRSTYRIAGGAGGWGTVIPSRGYANDAGVKVFTILRDAAARAGETLDLGSLPTTSVGAAFTRAKGPAGRVLQELVPERWYVGEDGITRVGQRSGAAALDVQATRTSIDLARGRVVLAADEIATILPGVIVDGITIVDVLHELTPKGLRSTVWGATAVQTSRRLGALRRLVLQLLPDYRFHGTYAYRVVTQESERLNLQPVRVSTGLPDLRRVRVMPGVAGARADVALGSTVLVTFVDADPARPVVIGFEDAEGAGFSPSRLDLVGEDDIVTTDGLGVVEAGRVVRYGDTVIMPSGAAATPTPTVLKATTAPGPATVSRVFP